MIDSTQSRYTRDNFMKEWRRKQSLRGGVAVFEGDGDVCPVCKGAGRVRLRSIEGAPYTDCRRCHGTGVR